MDAITVEYRPRLCSCYVFISLQQESDSSNVKIKLNTESISLEINNRVKTIVLPGVKIIPSSLSSLNLNGNWVSFRIHTQPSDTNYGSFSTEILKAESDDGQQTNPSSIELPEKEVPLILVCACCENSISKEVTFKRVLPLPDIDCDPSDWFCCQHNGESIANSLKPRDSDYLYSSYYCQLHRDKVNVGTIVNKRNVVCNRCFSSLGELVDENSIKVWNCSFKYKTLGCPTALLKGGSNPLEDFILAARTLMNASDSKEVLLCATEADQVHYALIKIMEVQLDVFVEGQDEVIAKDNICLRQIRASKILYKYGGKEILNNQHKDLSSCYVAISAMNLGIKYLMSTTMRYSPIYRTVDNCYIGFMRCADSSLTLNTWSIEYKSGEFSNWQCYNLRDFTKRDVARSIENQYANVF